MRRDARTGKGAIPATEVRTALDRILRSEAFSRSPRLSDFLKFIVEATLGGEASLLKGYTIGVEVFGKPESFDPEQDASVRVDATRLRRALAAYYSGDGRDDPVRISVPSGSYVPVFSRRDDARRTAATGILAALASMSPRGYAAIAVSILVLGAAIGIIAFRLVSLDDGRDVAGVAPVSMDDTLARPSGPTIAVLPLKAIGDSDAVQLASGFTHQLLTDLTRFKSVRVLGRETVRTYSDLDRSPDEVGGWLNADYVVEGSLQHSDDKTHIVVRLLDVATASYVWSYSSDETIRPDNIFQIQGRIAGEIAARLGQPYGVVQRVEMQRVKASESKSLDSYKCVLSHYDYAGGKSAEKHARVRECLERAVEEAPNYTDAWALLSWMYGDEVRFGYNLRTDAADAIKRAEYAATQAVKSDPESPLAHQFAATAAMLRKDVPGVRLHLERALALNPNDADILADAGWVYTQLGEWELGKSLVEKAIWLNPGHPRWYYGVLFAYHYHRRNYEEALKHALFYYQADALLACVALAAAYGKLNLRHESDAAVIHLIEQFPTFVSDPRTGLQGWQFTDQFMDELLEGLHDAGLSVTPAG